jgi:predicted small lipoprotein YifL
MVPASRSEFDLGFCRRLRILLPDYPGITDMKPCWASYLLWLVIGVAGVGAMLSSCGQKGDLYLPEQTENKDDTKK